MFNAHSERGHNVASSDPVLESTQVSLSKREREVLRLLCIGKTNKEIGAQLCICEKTVEKHLTRLYIKLGVRSRAKAILYVVGERKM